MVLSTYGTNIEQPEQKVYILNGTDTDKLLDNILDIQSKQSIRTITINYYSFGTISGLAESVKGKSYWLPGLKFYSTGGTAFTRGQTSEIYGLTWCDVAVVNDEYVTSLDFICDHTIKDNILSLTMSYSDFIDNIYYMNTDGARIGRGIRDVVVETY